MRRLDLNSATVILRLIDGCSPKKILIWFKKKSRKMRTNEWTGTRRHGDGGGIKGISSWRRRADCCEGTFTSSVNMLMHVFNWKWSLILFFIMAQHSGWNVPDERISLYWTRLNVELMKAYADNSFFIISLARLGFSFSFFRRRSLDFLCFQLGLVTGLWGLEYDFP